MRLQWINRDHDLIAKRTLWVRFHYYFKKKKGGRAVILIIHQSRTLKEKCQPFRHDSEQWLMGLPDMKTLSRRERQCFYRATRKHAGANQDQNQCLQHRRQGVSPKYWPLFSLLWAATFFLWHPLQIPTYEEGKSMLTVCLFLPY